jgi:hypothetical protein
MENQIINAIASELPASKKQSADGEKTRQENQVGHFKPRAGVLLDEKTVESTKFAEPTRKESPEGMLQQLLISTETSAEKTQSSRRRWQLLSLMLAMVLIPAVAIIGWLYVEMNATGTQRGRLQMENQTLKEQLNTAGTQITGFKDEMEALLSRNIELVSKNAGLKSQGTTSAAAITIKAEQRSVEQQVTQKPVAITEQVIDASRVEAIKKGKYPSGTTRAELIMALGEPDRVYKSRNYEQLVYFGHKPGRFWFIGNWLVQTTE